MTGLTEPEQDFVIKCGFLWNDLCGIIGMGATRNTDLAELIGHVHALQHAVMAQAAAREYPDQFRLLGETLTP